METSSTSLARFRHFPINLIVNGPLVVALVAKDNGALKLTRQKRSMLSISGTQAENSKTMYHRKPTFALIAAYGSMGSKLQFAATSAQ